MTTGLRSSGGVLHDIVKAMAGRVGEGIGYEVELEPREYTDLLKNPFRPDIVMRWRGRTRKDRHETVFIEVQKDVSPLWLSHIKGCYGDREVLVLSLDDVPVAVVEVEDGISILYGWVKDHVEAGTERAVKRNHQRRQKKQCRYCQKPLLNLQPHEYNCKHNPKNK